MHQNQAEDTTGSWGDQVGTLDPFDSAQEQFEQMVEWLQSGSLARQEHSEVEEWLDEQGRELLRRMLQGHLDWRGPGEALEPVVGNDEVERPQRRERKPQLISLFGRVQVGSVHYSQRGSDSRSPLEAQLNVPQEAHSHALRKRLALEVMDRSFEEAQHSLERSCGVRVGKRQAEGMTQRAAQDFEGFYAQRQVSPEQVAQRQEFLLVLSFDGKGVLVVEEDLRAATQAAARQRRHKLGHRLSPGEKRHAKRMATVCAVYDLQRGVRTAEEVVGLIKPVTDADLPRPRAQDKRVWASLAQEPQEVMEQAFEEALRRDPQRRRTWVALVDGDPRQIRRLRRLARRYQVELIIVLDLVHVLEYLWQAAWALHPDKDPQAECWVQEKLLALLQGEVSQVAAAMRRSATCRGLSKKQRKPIDKCANYLLKYKAYLRYDQYLVQGLPLATGVIEGACRHLVQDRLGKTGARWRLKSAEAVLRLRALYASGDFEEYWLYHRRQEYQRNHASRYADSVPAVQLPADDPPSSASVLRLV